MDTILFGKPGKRQARKCDLCWKRPAFSHPRKRATLDCSRPGAGMQWDPTGELLAFNTSKTVSRIKAAGCPHALWRIEPLEAQRTKDKQERTGIFRRLQTDVHRSSDTIRVSLTHALSLMMTFHSSNVYDCRPLSMRFNSPFSTRCSPHACDNSITPAMKSRRLPCVVLPRRHSY
jgi:hypothetical protein